MKTIHNQLMPHSVNGGIPPTSELGASMRLETSTPMSEKVPVCGADEVTNMHSSVVSKYVEAHVIPVQSTSVVPGWWKKTSIEKMACFFPPLALLDKPIEDACVKKVA